MSSVQCLREFINERLTAAAEEIFGVFQKTVVQYEEEIDRQRRLLDIVWKPTVVLHGIELPQQHVYKEKEVLADQQLCNQERNSSLDQEDPEPPQIKEEQEELCTSLEREQTETFMVIPTCEEGDSGQDQTLDLSPNETQSAAENEHVSMSVKSSVVPEPNCDDQLFSHNSKVTESQDHKGDKQEDSGSTRNTETKPQKTLDENSKDNSTALKLHSNTYTGEKSLKCDTCGKFFKRKYNLHTHQRVHTELPQQHVYKKEVVVTDQQLCDQERNSSLDQEDPEPPQIKKEQEELCTSLEGEQLVLKQETETFILTPTCEESDNSEDPTLDLSPDETQSTTEKEHVVSISVKSSVVQQPNNEDQLLSHNSHVAESQDHQVGKQGDSGSTRNTETKTQKRHHNSNSHTNSQCNSTTLKIHSNRKWKKSLKCNTCGKAFQYKSKLDRHQRIHTGEKPYICNTCEKRFSSASALSAHLTIHTGEKPYSCEICGKDFRCNDGLMVHMRTHTGEKPYMCNTCGKRFGHSSNFTKHKRTHTGEKPYFCDTCGKRFCKRSGLKKHLTIHTGENPHLCNTCGKRFCSTSALNVHLAVHTDARPYSCKYVGEISDVMMGYWSP